MNVKKILKLLRLFKNRLLAKLPRLQTDKVLVTFPLTIAQRQMIGSVIEKSGVKDLPELLAQSLSLFEKSVDHELEGGTIEFVEPNGVNRETLELLRHLNRDDEFWKEE